jgi:hypothetical protein
MNMTQFILAFLSLSMIVSAADYDNLVTTIDYQDDNCTQLRFGHIRPAGSCSYYLYGVIFFVNSSFVRACGTSMSGGPCGNVSGCKLFPTNTCVKGTKYIVDNVTMVSDVPAGVSVMRKNSGSPDLFGDCQAFSEYTIGFLAFAPDYLSNIECRFVSEADCKNRVNAKECTINYDGSISGSSTLTVTGLNNSTSLVASSWPPANFSFNLTFTGTPAPAATIAIPATGEGEIGGFAATLCSSVVDSPVTVFGKFGECTRVSTRTLRVDRDGDGEFSLCSGCECGYALATSFDGNFCNMSNLLSPWRFVPTNIVRPKADKFLDARTDKTCPGATDTPDSGQPLAVGTCVSSSDGTATLFRGYTIDKKYAEVCVLMDEARCKAFVNDATSTQPPTDADGCLLFPTDVCRLGGTKYFVLDSLPATATTTMGTAMGATTARNTGSTTRVSAMITLMTIAWNT